MHEHDYDYASRTMQHSKHWVTFPFVLYAGKYIMVKGGKERTTLRHLQREHFGTDQLKKIHREAEYLKIDSIRTTHASVLLAVSVFP